MTRSQPAPSGDVALLVARLLLGIVMFAHGYQKLVVNGIGRTTAGFESMSIPMAIVSASFVTVVEIVGGVLLVLELMTRTVPGRSRAGHPAGGPAGHPADPAGSGRAAARALSQAGDAWPREVRAATCSPSPDRLRCRCGVGEPSLPTHCGK